MFKCCIIGRVWYRSTHHSGARRTKLGHLERHVDLRIVAVGLLYMMPRPRMVRKTRKMAWSAAILSVWLTVSLLNSYHSVWRVLRHFPEKYLCRERWSADIGQLHLPSSTSKLGMLLAIFKCFYHFHEINLDLGIHHVILNLLTVRLSLWSLQPSRFTRNLHHAPNQQVSRPERPYLWWERSKHSARRTDPLKWYYKCKLLLHGTDHYHMQ